MSKMQEKIEKGVNTYKETRDLLYVQRLLGHKNIRSTIVFLARNGALSYGT